MRTLRATHISIALLILAASTFAQQQRSFAGGWQLDNKQSDFGSEPAPKFDTITIFEDTPGKLRWHVEGADEKGPFSYSWSGPEDGSMHPVTLKDGGDGGRQSAKKDPDGSILRHGVETDGSSFDGRSRLSNDGNTLVEEVTTKSKDGKEVKHKKFVFHRATVKHRATTS